MDLKTIADTPPWDWPDDAEETFLRILRDDQAAESDRVLAAELAGDITVINDELAGVLLSILCSGNESDEVRGQAAISLGPALEIAYTHEFEDPDDVLISEQAFRRIRETFRELYMDDDIPKTVRRRILEGSVHAPQNWHEDAVRSAYSSKDEDWKLTAVFSMCFVRGFDDEILESLDSENPDIHYHAVCAAGNWELDAAWQHIVALVTSEETEKSLLLAAIETLASINPQEAAPIIVNLTDSDDEDIAEAAYEAISMTDEFLDDESDPLLN